MKIIWKNHIPQEYSIMETWLFLLVEGAEVFYVTIQL